MSRTSSDTDFPRRVLVADDDDEFRCAVADLIELDGWCVCQASDGRQALDCARELRPDVLLIDHRMPGLTGVEVVRKLRAERILVPVVMVSAAHDLDDLADAAGIPCRLLKPFSFDELGGVLRRAVRGRC